MFDLVLLDDGESITRVLKTIGTDKNAVAIFKKGMRSGLAPMVKAAKRNAPKDSGLLRASLGVYMAKRAYKGLLRAKVWPRPKIKRTVKGEKQNIDISEKRSGHPRTYAFRVNYGFQKNNPLKGRRRAGPSYFLNKAYDSQKRMYTKEMSKRAWKEIKKLARKKDMSLQSLSALAGREL